MSNVVRCALCRFENERRCMRKNNKVKINKPRRCEYYIESRDKLEMLLDRKERSGYPEITTRPDHIWDGKYIKEWDGCKYIKVREEDRVSSLKASMGITDTNTAYNAKTREKQAVFNEKKHPLTGDLSRFFKSTAGSGDEKQTN